MIAVQQRERIEQLRAEAQERMSLGGETAGRGRPQQGMPSGGIPLSSEVKGPWSERAGSGHTSCSVSHALTLKTRVSASDKTHYCGDEAPAVGLRFAI